MIRKTCVLALLVGLGVLLLLAQPGTGLEARYDAEAAAGAAAAAEQAQHISEAGLRARPQQLGKSTASGQKKKRVRKAAAEAQVSIAALEPLASLDHRGPHSHRPRRQHPRRSSDAATLLSEGLQQKDAAEQALDTGVVPSRPRQQKQQQHATPPPPPPDSDAGSDASAGDSAPGAAASNGRITQWRKLLTVYYEGGAGDSGTKVTPSLASATVHWGLAASSPHFDNAPHAKADGEWGFWSVSVDQDVPLIQAPGQTQPYIRIEGNASYPTRVTMVGRLSSILSAIPAPDIDTDTPSTRTTVQGEPPPHFLASTHKDMALTVCEYSGPCNWAVEPNLGPMVGKLTVSPSVDGSYSITDMINRKWVPQGVLEVVCTLNPGQEKLVECPAATPATSNTKPSSQRKEQ